MGTFGAPGEAQVQKSVGECPKPNFFCAQAQIFRTPSVQEYIISLLSFQYHVSEAYELFLCFDGAKIAKSHVDQVDSTTRAVLDVNPAQAAPLMLLCWNCFQWS